MTDETMQAEAPTDQAPTNVSPDVAVNPEGAESSPAEEQKVTFDDRQQEKLNGIIGGQVKKTRDAERRTAELAQQNEELRKQIPQETVPEIPPMPDDFDDDRDEKIKLRDEAITKRATIEAQQGFANQQTRDAQQQQLRQTQIKQQENGQKYQNAGEKLGLTEKQMTDSLIKTGEYFAAFKVDGQIGQYIQHDVNGPLIVDYLAKNPLVIEEISAMLPMQASLFLEQSVKPAAMSSIKTTNAPPPATTLDGGGVPSKQRGAEGAAFE